MEKNPEVPKWADADWLVSRATESTYVFVVGDLGSRRSTTCCATAPFRLQGGDNGRRNNIPRLRAVAHQSPSGLPLVAVYLNREWKLTKKEGSQIATALYYDWKYLCTL